MRDPAAGITYTGAGIVPDANPERAYWWPTRAPPLPRPPPVRVVRGAWYRADRWWWRKFASARRADTLGRTDRLVGRLYRSEAMERVRRLWNVQ